MEKRRHYLTKDSDHLLRMSRELARDAAWCQEKADSMDKGSEAFLHYAGCVKANNVEIKKLKEELSYRGVLQ